MLDLNETTFDQQTAQGTVVVDFSAEWCPPCRALAPRFERVAETMAADATFATVDAETNAKLLLRFDIKALPTILVFRDGQPVHSIRGYRDEQPLAAELRGTLDRR